MTESFFRFFRVIFVVFSLYLLSDAFNRWDGFSYYASFREFLPSVGLAYILWSIVSFCAAVLLWLLVNVLFRLCKLAGMRSGMEHILLFSCIAVLTGMLAWKVKTMIWPLLHTSHTTKLLVFLAVALLSLALTWLLRTRAERLVMELFLRITPLVWIFGVFVVLSVPLVAYTAWYGAADNQPAPRVSHDIPEDTRRPNIVLVTFDALAARHMSLYGYRRTTTPFISEWARNATIFARAEASSNFTTPAAASLMTGKRVWTHQTYHIAGSRPLKSGEESLPALLKDHGYFTMAFVVNPFASVQVLGMSESFDVAPPVSDFGSSPSLFGWKFGVIDRILYRVFAGNIRLHNWILKSEFIFSKVLNLISRNITETPVPPERVFSRFLEAVDNNVPGPYFAWIHVFPPHDPYLPPEPFQGDYSSALSLRNYKKQEQLIEESYKYLFAYRSYPDDMQPSVNVMRDYYDEFVKYIDDQYGKFIAEFEKKRSDNTVMILSADHGESFEHGYLTHGGPFLYESVTHIPLVIKEDGQDAGQVISGTVEQIDIPATILDLSGIPVPEWMEGRSLVPLMRGDSLPARPAYSMNFEENRSRGAKITRGAVSVWESDYKLIHYLEKKEFLLFNLRHDPDELQNLISSEPFVSQRLMKKVSDTLIQINEERNGMLSVNRMILK